MTAAEQPATGTGFRKRNGRDESAIPRPRVELPGGRRIGPHLRLTPRLLGAAGRAAEIGASALQVFTDNPTAWRRRAHPPPGLAEFRGRLEQLDIAPLAIHAAYLVNLAGPDDGLFQRSIGVLRSELAAAPEFGARYVNVHAGSHRGSGLETGIDRLVDGLELTLGDVDDGPGAPLVVLENAAGGGYCLGRSVAELAAILGAVDRRGLGRRIALCLDTAHLWGAGYDVGSPAAIDALLAEFDGRIGLERLVMIHLNDTHAARGSLHDRHAHVGAGEIGPVGLAHFLLHPLLGHVTYYLETPGSDEGFDEVNMGRIADLVAGRPLAPLPDQPSGRGEASAALGAAAGSHRPLAGRGAVGGGGGRDGGRASGARDGGGRSVGAGDGSTRAGRSTDAAHGPRRSGADSAAPTAGPTAR